MMDEFHMRSYIDRLEKDRSKLLQKNVDLECQIAKLNADIKNLTATNEKLTKLFRTPPSKYPKDITSKPHHNYREEDKLIDEIAAVYDDIRTGVGFLFVVIGIVCFLAIVISWMIERIDVIHPVIYVAILISVVVQLLISLSPSKEYLKKVLRLHRAYKK